jgi:Uma2 family endonuclease
MNAAITRAAEGFPRRAFTVDDISRMMEAGVIGEDERFELIEGDLVVMPAKPVGHDLIKSVLSMTLAKSAPDRMYTAPACSLQLAKDILVEPDIAIVSRAVYAAGRKTFARPRPEDVPLLIEIAASSLAYDRGIKARLYARHGIREFGSLMPTRGSPSCIPAQAARLGLRLWSADHRMCSPRRPCRVSQFAWLISPKRELSTPPRCARGQAVD